MKCRSFLAAALILFSLPAYSQLYVSVGLGSAVLDLDDEDFDFGTGRRSDTKDTGYQVNLGYRFTPNWAAEVGVAKLGEYSVHHLAPLDLVERIEVNGIKVAAIGMYPGTGPFSIYGKLGIASTKMENDVFGDHRRNSLLAGFGAQYNITPRIGVRGEYESWGETGNQTDTGRARLSLLNILAVFSF